MRKAKAPEKIGQYEVEECIGEGSMGEIWLCLDPYLQRKIVVKRMQLALRGYDDLVQRFTREVAVLAAMNHPNVVHVYGFWQERGLLNLSMEYIHGWTLKELLEMLKIFPAWAVCACLWDCLNALGHVHRMDFVHRDLKPGNIMLASSGRIKLLDFGIARVENQEITMPGTMIGTAAYMSPEQLRGESASEYSDIFSLGIIAFEMLCGKHPFRDENAEKTARNILKEKITPLNFAEGVPSDLRRLVCRMLSKEASKRGKAYDCLMELDKIMIGLPRELTFPLKEWLRCKRKDLPLPPPPPWRKGIFSKVFG